MSSERDAITEQGFVNRRSFLQASGGLATGLAIIAVPSAAGVLAAPGAAEAKPLQLVDPRGDMPDELVIAYVHNAERSEVTVVSGTVERTYRDPVLAKRLLAAAAAPTA